jgi:hypothetical protein
MINVGYNLIFAVGMGLLAASAVMTVNLFRRVGSRNNPALVAFLTFVVVFGVLMAWDVNR